MKRAIFEYLGFMAWMTATAYYCDWAVRHSFLGWIILASAWFGFWVRMYWWWSLERKSNA
jgi:hypothetical protein